MTDKAETGKDGKRYPLTLKQQAFCRAYLEQQGNASAAYKQAYDTENMTDKSVTEAASVLMDNRNVASRIENLQLEAMERHETTVDSITVKLGAAYSMAKGEKQSSAMTSAALGEAKLHGLLIEKREVKVTTADMSDAQIEAELALIRAEHDDLVTPIVTLEQKSKLTH